LVGFGVDVLAHVDDGLEKTLFGKADSGFGVDMRFAGSTDGLGEQVVTGGIDLAEGGQFLGRGRVQCLLLRLFLSAFLPQSFLSLDLLLALCLLAVEGKQSLVLRHVVIEEHRLLLSIDCNLKVQLPSTKLS
jgi:hypothetical protein